MTILEIASNAEWITLKSGDKRNNSDFQFWIIKNSYPLNPDAETIKLNTMGPLDKTKFYGFFKNESIELELKEIE